MVFGLTTIVACVMISYGYKIKGRINTQENRLPSFTKKTGRFTVKSSENVMPK